MQKSALILIEFQKEWLSKNGKINFLMQDHELFHTAIERAKHALEAARKYHVPVVHCGLRFQEGYPELGQASHGIREAIKRVGSFLADEIGSQFVEPFTPGEREFVVQGRIGASGFSGSNLDIYLRNQEIKHIYLAGFALHVCVESTLRHGHDLGYSVTVLEDACSSFNQAQQKHVLEEIVHHYGEKITVDTFVKRIQYPLKG